MLIYYRFNNFCSFHGENEFSLEVPLGKVRRRYEDSFVAFDDGFDVFKTALIVGENAGGKTNFIESLRFLKSLFLNNREIKAFQFYLNESYIDEHKSQDFEIALRAKNQKVYIYHLTIDEEGILNESLKVIKKRKAKSKTLFEYKNNQFETSSKIKVKHLLKERGMGLFISKLALLNDEDAMNVVDWMNDVLLVETFKNDVSDLYRKEADLKVLKDDRYLEIFQLADESIQKIIINEENPYTKTIIVRQDHNGKLLYRELQNDSSGLKEYFVWSIYIYRVIYENRVVFLDEMDRVLNPVLANRIISFIHGTSHNGQFIFTSHNILHLDLRTYMKEQLYFITKKQDQLVSELYSLKDFPELRYETAKVYELYLKGMLGGT